MIFVTPYNHHRKTLKKSFFIIYPLLFCVFYLISLISVLLIDHANSYRPLAMYYKVTCSVVLLRKSSPVNSRGCVFTLTPT